MMQSLSIGNERDHDRPAARRQQAGPRALLASFCFARRAPTPARPVASPAECDAFRRWLDDLPPHDYQALLQLRRNGFTYDLPALRAELRRALEAVPPGPEGGDAGRRLLALLAGARGAACFLLEEGPLSSP